MNDRFDAKAFLSTVTSQPGVYRMYDATGTVIYVGKAKDLKKRLASYFRQQVSSRKTETLVKNIAQIDVTVTHTETEALLLEHNYIKLYQPRYNVLLRDDKSYPLIFLSADTHPRLAVHRQTGMGIRTEKNQWVRFIVSQKNIISRLVQFNVVMFQQQRFCFGMGNRYVYLRDIFNQRLGFTAADLLPKIAGETLFQVFGFTDVDHRTRGVVHTVDAGLAGDGTQEGFGIKTVIHCLTTSPH